MARLIVRYLHDTELCWGEVNGDAPSGPDETVRVAPLKISAQTTAQLLEAYAAGPVASGGTITVRADRLVSPITVDATIFAQGLNYQAHAAEAQYVKRTSNLIFNKASSSLTGPFADVVRPAEVKLLDYEVEFGIVLRRDLGASDPVTAATLGEAVAGVVLCNDVSARDTMFGTSFMQWYRGKSYRTFCPAGPALWLLEVDEVVDALASIEIALAVNGEERQRGSAEQLIWSPAETLTYIASSIDVRRGDLLLTGTPGGVTAPATPAMVKILQDHLLADDVRREALREEMTKKRPFLEPGDCVTATISGGGRALGGLANTVRDAA